MLQLMKMYFVAPPSVEIQGLMNALYENEKKKKDVGHSRLVSFIRPAHQIPYPPQEGAERPFTSYLEPHPTLPLSYFLDATFNPIIEAQVASEKLGVSSYALSLTGRLPSPQHGREPTPTKKPRETTE
ncbi:uncharacterized protein ACA1_041740 [Acanthamoeba castellanii str. Neff]|uniref:Uncharacterized protein n=1 Tax=Acanthamoeba castellanii (strain ATCC 30010 / Neff) TaxID=1257118 RepID=L8GV74_ACACF|nr:uncharacterized protein ACA1_041740 [Acanthamoeba castellanii str. Neff]ELR16847.1 hypothetical protein ACA1_041740 [Acanthamoeba castellanii str. Neff]